MSVDIKKLSKFAAEFWNKSVRDVRKELGTVRPKATGLTEQSIISENTKLSTILSSTSFVIRVKMPEQYKYLDEGVRGFSPTKGRQNTGRFRYGKTGMNPPPIKGPGKILHWMQARGITPKSFQAGTLKRKDKSKAFEDLAWAISWSIFKEGLSQTGFFSKVINEKLLKDFEEKITEFAGEQVFLELRTAIK